MLCGTCHPWRSSISAATAEEECTKPKEGVQSGPLNRLNAMLSLLQPLDRFWAPSAIESAIGRPLSRPISRPRTGRSPQPPHSKPLSRLNRAIVAQESKTPFKQARNKNAIDAAILNRVLDRDWTLNRRGPLRRGPTRRRPKRAIPLHTNDYRTELYCFWIIFGNSCSVITEPNCFWN